MHNTMMFRYLKLYAENFELIPHMKFNHRVDKLEPASDYDSTGRWKLTAVNLCTYDMIEDIVDAVMICSGHHLFPYMPKFPGQEKFRGTISHTHSYKSSKGYEDKRVVVVGVGNSGGDAAVETSSVARKVNLSTRTGCWVIHRVGDNGFPIDDANITRFFNILFNFVPLTVSSWFMERIVNQRFDHETYQLKPRHRFLQQHPMVNDSLPNKIISGTVEIKGNIQRFEENGVVFEGESEVTEVDNVIFATGYDIKFPFLDKEIIDTTDNHLELYKFMYPPKLKHPTLVAIGLIQSPGGFFPIFEMQSRWFVQVLKKKVSLPTVDEMIKDIHKNLETIRKRYYNSKRHTIQVDYINYLDEIACLIGAKPNFLKFLLFDTILFWVLLMGPSLPYQYRLQGPYFWDKARETILGYKERIVSPFYTRFRGTQKSVFMSSHL
ncbi:dimethylaniline monooxygenase [N-oxide-forming] 5-like [Centruroides sculpturatus]|uniref:dimethylaniline monooxygenase [N-oxide-forming] 5-like n=1 Tax=Centruroides sculpturatus TaxID=218467 RepID=UPI000C6EC250|nr:dimethylaniline monooxygenase [N-oxide-forming] 5-like [Centruroides sculpturatus]